MHKPPSSSLTTRLVLLTLFLIIGQKVQYTGIAIAHSQSAGALHQPSGPYCGVYCVYSLLRLAGRSISFKDLLEKEYIGSRSGSSLAELKKAAEDNGLYTKLIGGLTSRDLRSISEPVILHVKSKVDQKNYDHYEVFLGCENKKARVFDPPHPVHLVSFHDLAPRWDGNGLVVSTTPINMNKVEAWAKGRIIFLACVVTVAVLFVCWVRRCIFGVADRFESAQAFIRVTILQGISFAVVALLCGVLYHSIQEEGLISNARGTKGIQRAYAGTFLPRISYKKVKKLLSNHNAVFIDARFSGDYEAGHVQGAINVPVDANDVERLQCTVVIPKESNIVVYCQSSGCAFAEKVALQLHDDGFSKVAIFRGGWNEYTDALVSPIKKGEI